ncbi:hypothetical protein AQUCO_01500389v1 [Aquilegia coerulea]|uniref:DUF241 domain-containing protein n=1 Tax=Aquilegia coerulea TaxID=218851 RepID=A0A2G5DTH8_AQUCA|nr:hypothetical protein AQUCO_01500389v1 [Aquilegia coerulea]
MATSPLNLKASYHVRSISLPSRSHPLTLTVEEQLNRIRSSEATSSASTCNNFSDLNNLYESVHDLLQLSMTQNSLSNKRSNKRVNEVLDGSLGLLDICSSTRDVFMQIEECVQDLQSTLRRKKEHGVANEVNLYMIARKKLNRLIQKCLSEVKRAENKNTNSSIIEKDQGLVANISVLREVESTTLSMLKSLLTSVSSSKLQTKITGWSFVSKFIGKKSSQGIQVMNIEDVQKSLDLIQSSLHGLDGELECIYKSLIKTRVSLLNILSQ